MAGIVESPCQEAFTDGEGCSCLQGQAGVIGNNVSICTGEYSQKSLQFLYHLLLQSYCLKQVECLAPSILSLWIKGNSNYIEFKIILEMRAEVGSYTLQGYQDCNTQ